jgi:endonuclease/exonuclease/phosphatase family metal-dependent hydrolase
MAMICMSNMRFTILFFVLLVLLVGCTTLETHDRGDIRNSLRVMTFNIKWEGVDKFGEFHDSGFAMREPLVINVLTKSDSDIIGLQEASIEQRATIAPELDNFGIFPSPGEPGDECILYRLSRFDLMDSGHENLRQQPERPGTNIGVRNFVWIYLQDKITGRQFYVINLHLDHRSSSRGRQLDGILIGEWIRKRGISDPVIITGDINGTPSMPRYLYLTGQNTYPDQDGVVVTMPMPMLDTFSVANPEARYSGTSNSGYSGQKNKKQIDYVFVPRETKVISSRIIYYNVNGSYPSDHFPVLSEIEL